MKIIFLSFLFTISISHIAVCQSNYDNGKNEYFNGDIQKAIVLFTNSIEDKQNVAGSYMMRGAAKGKTGDLNGAIKDLDSSKSLDSENYKLFFYYGRVYLITNNLSMALKYYNIALDKNSGDADSYDDRAMTKIELTDYEGGIADENAAITIDPKNYSYYINRGYAKMQLARYKDAIADYGKSLALSPSHKAFADRGFAFFQLKSFQLAIDDFSQALSIYPKDYLLLYQRGLAYKETGQKDKACADFKRCVDLGYIKAQYSTRQAGSLEKKS